MADYRLDIVGPHSDAYTRHVADALAESVSVLNHATQLQADTRDPATIHHVLGSLHAAAARLDQLLLQLGARLTAQAESGQLADTRGNTEGSVTRTRHGITAARRTADQLTDHLNYAFQATSGLYLRDESEA